MPPLPTRSELKSAIERLWSVDGSSPLSALDRAFGRDVMSPIITGEKKIAGWTPERLERELRISSYGDGRSKSWLSFVDPKDFIPATSKLEHRAILDSEILPLNEAQLKKEIQSPFLRIMETSDGEKIYEHEGRHRMAALADAGFDRVPIVLQNDYPNVKAASGGGRVRPQFHSGKAIFTEGRIPLHMDNREKLESLFAAISDMRFAIPAATALGAALTPPGDALAGEVKARPGKSLLEAAQDPGRAGIVPWNSPSKTEALQDAYSPADMLVAGVTGGGLLGALIDPAVSYGLNNFWPEEEERRRAVKNYRPERK